MRFGRLGVLVAATAMIVAPVWSAAAQDVPDSYTVQAVGAAAYTTVDKCCSLVISRLVDGGSAYVAGTMSLQRNLVTAAPQWPGELVATAPGTVGFVSNGAVPLPELPGYARASTPGDSDDATEVVPSGDVAAGNARVHSGSRGQTGDAVLASASSGNDGGRAEAHVVQTLSRTAATSTVRTSVADIVVGGVLHIGSVRVSASATSGAKGKTEIAIANCTVGPVPCTIDADGVHLQDSSPLALRDAQDALKGLAATGFSVFAGGGYTSAGAAVANGVIVEHVLTDPLADTETTRTVYGYASVGSASRTDAPLAGETPLPLGTTADAPEAPGGGAAAAAADTSLDGVAGATTDAVASDADGRAVSAAPSVEVTRTRPRLALVSRLSSGSVAWMGVGVLLWILAVGSRWAVR